ncbi:MAG: carbamoyl-phosphate synthase large subunit [SAR202 cluster bacterium]|nr:carbamoyl phosphate synthase large subunit [Chloroflexota bacterium]MQG50511.1 carbamoyl-phosphate synthase large subunit [SAR202 cluster bacterium]|tara:strand:- start:998 stop:4339 length:3342 start_codon:yes stop_codon:yes gene_type:complete
MGLDKDIKKVLIIGSGPIVIGQAAEFDYAGSQACRSIKEEGVETILINSNPATIMTDTGIADHIYIEPLTVEVITQIIDKERPDGLLPTLGGQTGLNLAVQLSDLGILDKYNVRLLGTPIETIKKAEDRDQFRDLLIEIGEPVLPSVSITSIEEARFKVEGMALPLVVRPAFTLGGTGGGVVYDWEEFDQVINDGLKASPVSQVLIESYLLGWKELEYEIMRDADDACLTICVMENMDPMGVHTGDSIVVAPSQTLSDKEYQMLRSASQNIIKNLGIEGGCNVQYALRPNPMTQPENINVSNHESEYYVIEVNPRVSRSSALASKATGYPIARVASKIAIGKTLDEIDNPITGKTSAAFEPALDYCVVKIPRWPFDKFPTGDRNLGIQMKATGEVMAIDRTFTAALQKAIRSLEISGHSLLWESSEWNTEDFSIEDLPLYSNDNRLWAIFSALRKNVSVEKLCLITGIDPWFINSCKLIVDMEKSLLSQPLDYDLLKKAKKMGFSDDQIATLTDRLVGQIRQQRKEMGIIPVYKMVDTCAAEFEAETPYFYSTYEQENEAEPLEGEKALVIGSGPIRIGQGIEFDYCSVHAAWALQEEGTSSIIVNSNPETVSTDFDTSSRLYFEPLDEESILDIIDNETGEKDKASIPPCVVQFGGQTAINLSQSLGRHQLPILGSSAEAIDIAADREKFEQFLHSLDIPQPAGAVVSSVEDGIKIAEKIGYPVLVRPSYVLGGRAMEVVQTPTELIRYLTEATKVGATNDVLIDKYVSGREVEVDAICDGTDVLIPGIMEHIERAGVHSGDSMAVYPGITLDPDTIKLITEYTIKIALGLKTQGLINIQFVIEHDQESEKKPVVYIIEANPRSSRTVPFMSKITDIPMVSLATKIMLGKKLSDMGYTSGLYAHNGLYGVKAPVFSMSKLAGVDTYLGPEMKSTGEVMGIDYNIPSAISKALLAGGYSIQPNNSILVSISDRDKPDAIDLMKQLAEFGCDLYATEGTGAMIEALGLNVKMITKRIAEGHPNVVDVIQDGTVDVVINTESSLTSVIRDGFEIRRNAVERRIPCFTSLDTARAAIENLFSVNQNYNVKSSEDYIKDVPEHNNFYPYIDVPKFLL